jgi:GLPGLI family protein
MDKTYYVQSKTTDLVWQISNEKKKIGNYTCIKAITKVEDKISTRGVYTKLIEAWFSPEIPIRLGPNNYGGLPGLIMELKEGKFTYYVKNINIEPDFEIRIEKPKGKVITQKEFFDRIPTITRGNIKEYIDN